jgi:5-methyltetrahydrofolate--homocysteine methyltransferase
MDILELAEFRTVLGDGAMGTMLLASGLKMGECPEAWNLDHPDVVGAIHRQYRQAGSDFVTTNTFGGNPIKLQRFGLQAKLEEMVRRAVELARQAAGETCMVAGSVGPTGAILEPYGDTPADRVKEAFGQAVGALDRAGVDFLLVETMTDINEARLALEAAAEVSSKPLLATMSFTRGSKGYRTVMGTAPDDAAKAMVEAGAQMVGTNCVGGMPEATDIMEVMVPAANVPTLAQPNAGLPQVHGDSVTYPESPQDMAEGLEKLLATGVRVVGGCCGTTPEHIRALAALLGKV